MGTVLCEAQNCPPAFKGISQFLIVFTNYKYDR